MHLQPQCWEAVTGRSQGLWTLTCQLPLLGEFYETERPYLKKPRWTQSHPTWMVCEEHHHLSLSSGFRMPCTYACVCAHVRTHTCTQACTRARTHTHTGVHCLIHSHTDTYLCMLANPGPCFLRPLSILLQSQYYSNQ